MKLVDPRRLLGRNALLPSRSGAVDIVAGATLELVFDPGEDPHALDALAQRLHVELAALCAAIGITSTGLVVRRHQAGASVGLPAALDELRTAVDVLEGAAVRAGAVPVDEVPPVDESALAQALQAERSPALLALLAEAARRDVPALLFDDGISLGHGRFSRMWSAGTIPAVDDVPWGDLRRVPVALITGTNGKTTTTRLLADMMRAATGSDDLVVGTTTTDGIMIGGALVATGDWSGPGGARTVLRHPDVGMAALETARGGLLRRGLAVEGADVAVITNVSEDHLGDYGVHDLEAMANVKVLVGHGVRPSGRVVLNARDARLVARAASFAAPVVLFSLKDDDPVAAAHVAAGGEACVVRAGVITLLRGESATAVIAVSDVPCAFGGAAAHNVENALAATAAGAALGLPVEALRAGLCALRPSSGDAHGRGLVREHGSVRLLLDFAHNPAGVQAALAFVARIRSAAELRGRLFVLTGAAGDRADDELRGVCAAIAGARPHRVIVRELSSYLRGRAAGEVPARLRHHLVAHGVDNGAISVSADDVAGLAAALDEARPGDTIAMLIHIDGPGTAALLTARGWG